MASVHYIDDYRSTSEQALNFFRMHRKGLGVTLAAVALGGISSIELSSDSTNTDGIVCSGGVKIDSVPAGATLIGEIQDNTSFHTDNQGLTSSEYARIAAAVIEPGSQDTLARRGTIKIPRFTDLPSAQLNAGQSIILPEYCSKPLPR